MPPLGHQAAGVQGLVAEMEPWVMVGEHAVAGQLVTVLFGRGGWWRRAGVLVAGVMVYEPIASAGVCWVPERQEIRTGAWLRMKVTGHLPPHRRGALVPGHVIRGGGGRTKPPGLVPGRLRCGIPSRLLRRSRAP